MSEFSPTEKTILLQTAHDAILNRLNKLDSINTNINLNLKSYPEHLLQPHASFVTLHLNNQLRGCIGSLVAHQPLIIDVYENARKAAFQDPRFKPVTLQEYALLTLDISVLSTPKAMQFVSEADLLTKIRPGIDGLILYADGHRGTFLPSVWQQLPDPKQFLQHLKLKAGLPIDYWSDSVRIEYYTTELIS